MSEKLDKCCCGEEENKCHCHDGEDCGCEGGAHKENCTCNEGCDCGCHGEHLMEEETVTLTMDNGETHEFYADGTIEYKGKYYAAFEPAEEIEGLDEGDVLIFEISGDDEETAELLPVEDEKLLDEVFEEFCKAFEAEEQDEEINE